MSCAVRSPVLGEVARVVVRERLSVDPLVLVQTIQLVDARVVDGIRVVVATLRR